MLPVEKNKEYTLTIESVTSEGMGVSHIDGFCVFVPLTVTGDVVRALIVKVKSSYAYAKVIEILEGSEYRTDAICKSFSKCGGCQLMHIDYDYQLKIKENIINDCLKRIGSIDHKVDEMIASDTPFRYRNKMIFPVGYDKNHTPVCGFYKERSHDIIPLDECYLGNEVCSQIVKVVMDFIKEYHIPCYDEIKHTGIFRRIFIRYAHHTKEIMVILSVNCDKLKFCDYLTERLIKISPDIKSIILNINKKKTNNVLGDMNVLLFGKEFIEDYLLGMKYEISPYSFFQINPPQTEKLYQKAIELANITKNDTVMDIYCGIGTISLAVAKNAKQVIGIEIVEQAILDARKNAFNNDVKNATFYAGDASVVVPSLINSGENPNVVILDPPRKGSDEFTLGAIISASPERIVYISCNPSTLARDLKFLLQNGYTVGKVVGVDMFSQTAHIECCVLLCRT